MIGEKHVKFGQDVAGVMQKLLSIGPAALWEVLKDKILRDYTRIKSKFIKRFQA